MQFTTGIRRRALIVAFALTGCIIGNGDKPSTTDLPRAPLVHRSTAPVCGATSAAEPNLAGVTNVSCTQNADCTGGANGRCVVSDGSSSCAYDACVKDLDCAGVAVCECGGAANSCVPNGCKDDHDCGEGGYCSPTQGDCGTRSLITQETQNGYPHHCHTKSDECLDDTDCAASGYCRYENASRTWRCATPCQ